MTEIEEHQDKYAHLNATVVAISTDTREQSATLAKKLGLSFLLLCDENRKVIDRYHLRNPFEHDGIAYPSTFIINSEGKVCYRSMDGTGRRVDLSDEIVFLEQLHTDAGRQMSKIPRKKWVLPSPKDMWRMTSNMVTIGNRADWKHLLLIPVSYLKILGSKLNR